MTQNVLYERPTGRETVALSSFRGCINGLYGDVLQGWAINITQPDQRPVIEIFVDGASVALVRADQHEPNAPHGDQFHGFTVQLRQSVLADANLITAQVANADFLLEGEIRLPSYPRQEAAAATSQIWHTGGLRVAGWSWDPVAPNRHVQITFREGERVIAQATCNTHHQALAYRATSDHGFAVDLPWELADGKLHVIEVVNDLGQSMPGSPIRLCCWPEGLERLIQLLEPSSNSAPIDLVVSLAKEQTLRLPKSAGWQHYPQWFDAFQKHDILPAPTTQIKPGLLLLTEGDAALEQISLESLRAGHDIIHEIAKCSSANLRIGLEQLLKAGCECIIPITAGARMANHSLAHMCAVLKDGSAWAFADCDIEGPQGQRCAPWFKPVWDIDLFIGVDIFSEGAIYGSAIVRDALVLLDADGSAPSITRDDLMAAVALATEQGGKIVSHLPRILYHRAMNSWPSPEQAPPSKQREDAVSWLCERLVPGTRISAVPEYPALLRAHWPLPQKLPRVSLIVPTRDQYKLLHACIEGLLEGTDYPNLEIIVVDNQSSDPETLAYLGDISERGVKVLSHPHPFNYSTINNRAASYATGEIIGLINNDIEIIEGGWLKEMVSQVMRPDVGAVGAKLLWPNRMVQHAGVVVGVNGLAAHTGNALEQRDPGYLGMNQISREQSAVTAACLLIRKTVFEAVEGLDERAFPVAFNDVDLCLRIHKRGLRVIWTAFAQLVHAESASRGKDESLEKQSRALREQNNFLSKWAGFSDPFYNPSLSLDYLTGPYGGLSLPPRVEVARHKLCNSIRHETHLESKWKESDLN
ncbi:glycosyltransferase family 2 protein [Pseudomonas putida]|uniref:glycosyltransferase family 2 protein n=1 Tax=Pseudomonas putida TaxID=303 RepID=UPI0023633719|nr:glycosyltransferase family 2 protein [Pseudomonas putida]EKT4452352.1 glycosyltransferase family 2 protein [Pseudomonas putida]MDD2069347.1 glycosyltransferase family 2 protein [Pseudomonas putida]HDS1742038.1 glycosyltransferase family 2 protein [Pseudomonas putida]